MEFIRKNAKAGKPFYVQYWPNMMNFLKPDMPKKTHSGGKVAEAFGATVRICDPFDIETTRDTLLDLIENVNGTKVLVLRQICALSPEKKGKRKFEMTVDEDICLGENCGCNRLCTRIFRCPGLIHHGSTGTAHIDDVLCAGCGVCADICPSGAISRKEVA
jgi:indolepyruvate ferredoxin oxidoreductase alpha subunit